jgi:DNA-directed RNA polymerase subunit L
MDLKVTEESSTKLELRIEKEDFSIPDIIHQEMLKDPKAVFAGVHQIHPILKQYTLKIESKKPAKPRDIIITASTNAVEIVALLMKAAQSAFEEDKK